MEEGKRIITLPEPAKFIRNDGTVMETKELHCPNNNQVGLHCITCGVCGKVLTFYEEKRVFKCALCGTEEENNCCCPENHYICRQCWSLGSGCFPCPAPAKRLSQSVLRLES